MEPTGTLYVGQEVQIEVKFRNKAGALADPTAGLLKLIDGEETQHEVLMLVRKETGIWTVNTILNCAGLWRARGISSGALIAIVEDTFHVQPTPFS